jgi:GNAT superfamily N-acetyltransferase
MTSRAATVADIPELIELGRAMHAESPFWNRFAFSPEHLAETLSNLIKLRGGFVRVATSSGKIVGAVLAVAEVHWMSTDVVVTELAFFVLPAFRGGMHAGRLLAAMVAWSEALGAKATFAGVSSGIEPERTAQMYERLAGFSRLNLVSLERVA